MARLTGRTTEISDCEATHILEMVLTGNLRVFDDHVAISNLEADAEPEKPLRIKFNLDQLEDSE